MATAATCDMSGFGAFDDLPAELTAAMGRIYGDEQMAAFASVWELTVAELAAAGFVPAGLLGGGLASVVWDGTFAGRRAVAKAGPVSSGIALQADAAVLWGPSLAPEVLAVSSTFAVFAHGGRPLPASHATDPVSLAAQLAVVRRLGVEVPAGAGFRPVFDTIPALVGLAASRPTSFAFHGGDTSELVDLSIAVAESAAAPQVLLHGDVHDRNWLVADDGSLRVIDPWACVGPAVADLVRWVLCGGPRRAELRASLVEEWPEHAAVWLRFLGRERAGALAHHGFPIADMTELVAACDRIAARIGT